jgi:hypothetical protein
MGFARGVWNFSVSDGQDGQTVLRTETRVVCGDAASRQKFLAYWLVVRPFSGLIRLIMLRTVRKVAEEKDLGRGQTQANLSYNPPPEATK